MTAIRPRLADDRAVAADEHSGASAATHGDRDDAAGFGRQQRVRQAYGVGPPCVGVLPRAVLVPLLQMPARALGDQATAQVEQRNLDAGRAEIVGEDRVGAGIHLCAWVHRPRTPAVRDCAGRAFRRKVAARAVPHSEDAT